MKRVLIITYYWPPSGGGGVQRWLKFSRYLPENDWQPVIYTPLNADYPLIDEQLLNEIPDQAEVIKYPITEPYRVFRNLSGKKKDTVHAGFISDDAKPSKMKRLLGWTRGNLFIPDARMLWIKPSVRYLSKYLKENPVDAVVSTGPPHSMHLIARELKNKLGIKWIADFRDPWVNMDHQDMFQMGPRAMRKHQQLEKAVIGGADAVISVSFTESKNYAQLGNTPVHTITNGFDEADFIEKFPVNQSKFRIGHFGTLGPDRDAPALWNALSELCEDPVFKEDLELYFAGPTDAGILSTAISKLGEEKVSYCDYLPHDLAVREMQRSAVLLLILNENGSEKGRIPGKIFEYMASDRFILGMGQPDSDSGRLLDENKCGIMLERNDISSTKSRIQEVYQSWKQQKPLLSEDHDVTQFSRKNLTTQLSELLNSISS